MTKSTAIITAILVALSIALLVFWYVSGLYLVDAPLDLIVDALWWVVIAICVVLVVRSEQKRRRAIRTIYVSPTSLYSSSTGVVACPDPSQRPATMRRMLDSVSYDYSKKPLPDRSEFECRYVVTTDRFEEGDDASTEGVRVWEGTVDTVIPGARQPVSSKAFKETPGSSPRSSRSDGAQFIARRKRGPLPSTVVRRGRAAALLG